MMTRSPSDEKLISKLLAKNIRLKADIETLRDIKKGYREEAVDYRERIRHLEAKLAGLKKSGYAVNRALKREIVGLKKDAAPFQAQIDQRKTYRVTGEDNGQS